MTNNMKRPFQSKSDMNNNEIVRSTSAPAKKKKSLMATTAKATPSYTIGQIKELRMLNFMCHKNFSIAFRATPMQIVTGANGSGKSAIANAICLCLGVQARTTGRTSNVQSFIRQGETSAEISITLANEGVEAYKPELYGKEIQIVRKVFAARSAYKVLSDTHKVISTSKETIAEIIQALSISPDNPLCVLHQEIAKTFLMNSDARKKYQFYMKVSQLDQIKQAYEEAVCTVQSIALRIKAMKEKHTEMLRATQPLEQQVKKIEIRRDQEEKRKQLESELVAARGAEAQQELATVKNELDQTQKTKDEMEKRMAEATNQMREIEQKIADLNGEKADIDKDLSCANGLRELNYQFGKQKKELDFEIYRLSNACGKYHQRLHDLEYNQQRLRKEIEEYQTLSQKSNHGEEVRQRIDQEIQDRQRQQFQWDQTMATYVDSISSTNDVIREKQSTLDCIRNEFKQKQRELGDVRKSDAGRTNAFGAWMADCVKAIENDHRFHKKPIGPLGRYVRCIEPRWSYAVDKHLASIMTAFICCDGHDEAILLEHLTSHCRGERPPIYRMKYFDRVHDISGTLERIRRTNQLSIHQVLKIDHVVVECALIDFKHIEATILLDDLAHAKRVQQSGVLRWPRVDNKVKQVGEAWTCDGSNIRLDSAFRIYTNDRRPARYFTANNAQSLSSDEINVEIGRLQEQIDQASAAINELRVARQKAIDNLEALKRATTENKKKIKDLSKELDGMTCTMPATSEQNLDDLKRELSEIQAEHAEISKKFDEAKETKEIHHQELAEVTQKFDNIVTKIEAKTKEIDDIAEKIADQQSAQQDMQQQIARLTKKSVQLNDDIQKYEERIRDLTKNLPRKSKASKSTTRSVREIQQELDGIIHFLKSNEDTQEQRRQVIEEFRSQQTAAQAFKKLYERCQSQLKHLETFVQKRKERFGTIADQQKYLLRQKFQSLMEKHHFENCDIKIDHKKEELEIIIRKNERSVSSLSGGERSLSTFCFLIALWGSIYQPFRLMDEIDIYMDNEKRNSSLELLFESTQYYSSSQHVIFTPQTIDPQVWETRDVPVFRMPTPKRSLE